MQQSLVGVEEESAISSLDRFSFIECKVVSYSVVRIIYDAVTIFDEFIQSAICGNPDVAFVVFYSRENII